MIMRFFRPRQPSSAVTTAYHHLVAWSRDPWFFTHAKVPDTLDGRFDMLSLMLALLLIRLEARDRATRLYGRQLMETFNTDMDRSLREMGVGDMSVGKHVKRMARGFWGRMAAYRQALLADENAVPDPLAAALSRNIFGQEGAEAIYAAPLAIRVRRIHQGLLRLKPEQLLAGHLGDLP